MAEIALSLPIYKEVDSVVSFSMYRDTAPVAEEMFEMSFEDLIPSILSRGDFEGIRSEVVRREHLVTEVTSRGQHQAIINGVGVELAGDCGADELMRAGFFIRGLFYECNKASNKEQDRAIVIESAWSEMLSK